MLTKSTIQLLRFHFSIFLLPVYLFAVSQVVLPNGGRAVLIFFILHVLVYPASNGYNSYMDKDESAIGGLENPPLPTRQLLLVTLLMNLLAIGLSLFIGIYFAIVLLVYILASIAYSYRGVRLKKYAIVGYLTVVIFQGAVTFWLVYYGSHPHFSRQVPFSGMLASSLLIGGFYPLTQIYQHEADRKDGVQSISSKLGYKGTFIFTAVVYAMAVMALSYHFLARLEWNKLMMVLACMTPILGYFFFWANKVWKNQKAANFTYTMRMTIIGSCCTNLAFIILLIWNRLE
jgi:1,4-dihydroxy-2-naphthoate polyprenyltransferase